MRSDEAKKIEAAFAPLKQRLRLIERRINPLGKDLHVAGKREVLPGDFDELLALAEDGLRMIRQFDSYFGPQPGDHGSRMYDDGFVWYDLFLLISAASLRGRAGISVPKAVLRRLVEVLVDVSHYSLAALGREPGALRSQGWYDILKRNYEALGNVLYGFPDSSLRELAVERGKQSPQVAEFVEVTLEAVQRIKNRRKT